MEEQPEEMGNHLIYEHDLKFFQYFGVIMGVEMKFNWKPGIMFFVSLFLISIIISQIVYTTYLHIRNQNYYRILETLACYGITISVRETKKFYNRQRIDELVRLRRGRRTNLTFVW